MRRVTRLIVLLAVVIAIPAFAAGSDSSTDETSPSGSSIQPAYPGNARTAVFAGGCFWCMEEAFEKVEGVADAISGYAGGTESNPEYYAVAGGQTSHTEVVQIVYDPDVVSYEDLLYVFWRNVDLLDGGGQFCDRGQSYRTGIFYVDEQEKIAAENSKAELEAAGLFARAIATEIVPLDVIPDDDNDGFWIAEDYHQAYYKTNSVRYQLYKEACGRVRRLTQLWGDEAGGLPTE